MSKKRKENQRTSAHAIHLQAGDEHVFALGNIQVLITESSDGWFAQGVQVDYFACGVSLEDVQNRFTQGLTATLEEHLRRNGTIEKFLKWAPDEVRAAIQSKINSEQYNYTVVNSCHIEKPTLNIIYYKEEPKLQAA